MSGNPNPNQLGFFARLSHDIREYVERCFGVNDIEARYEREKSQVKPKAAKKVPDGYETSTKNPGRNG